MNSNRGLRWFSKGVVLATLFLIFVGGMVKSTESGLAVPDWPLSWGSLFPPMVGGVFYEHGHRMVAAFVGLLTVILAVWLQLLEKRRWVKVLGYCALGTVILQGVLGGLTVLFLLPTLISVSHAVLAQTFFILTIILAYSQSGERLRREDEEGEIVSPKFRKIAIGLFIFIFVQLVLGAFMRHTQSGLAIPDFPTMGGQWIPRFDEQMYFTINDARFEMNLNAITMGQVAIHFCHRLQALIILITSIILCIYSQKFLKSYKKIQNAVAVLFAIIIGQVLLGIMTVLTAKAPVLTSIHVAVGAAALGTVTLLMLRIIPVHKR